jgi:hypothetical protein
VFGTPVSLRSWALAIRRYTHGKYNKVYDP